MNQQSNGTIAPIIIFLFRDLFQRQTVANGRHKTVGSEEAE